MPSNRLIPHCPLLFLPSIFPSIRVVSANLTLQMQQVFRVSTMWVFVVIINYDSINDWYTYQSPQSVFCTFPRLLYSHSSCIEVFPVHWKHWSSLPSRLVFSPSSPLVFSSRGSPLFLLVSQLKCPSLQEVFLNSSLLAWVRGALLSVLMAFITLICVCKRLCWELLEGSTRLSGGMLSSKCSVGPQKDSLDILFDG